MTRRRGRKRHINAKRYPGGRTVRLSPTRLAEDIQAVAMAARQRVFGLTPDQAVRMPETSVLGWLCATGEISARQNEAASIYHRLTRSYDKVMGWHHPTGVIARMVATRDDEKPVSDRDVVILPTAPHDGTDQDYVEWCEGVVMAFDDCRRALAGCGDRFALSVVNAVVLSDRDIPFFIGALRVGLNALAQALRLPPEPEPERASVTERA